MTGYDESNYSHTPRILLFDIECTPMLGYTWGKWQQNVLKFTEDWWMLSFAYRWYGTNEKVKVRSLPMFPGYEDDLKNDEHLVKEMWELMNEADIVIAHNGDKFDVKKVNARFAVHGLPRPTPGQSVDTLKVARQSFAFSSNSLNDLGQFLDLGQKLSHAGFDLWLGCMAGEKKSWKIMEAYNKQDVVLLEQVYERFKKDGWIPRHPDIAILSGINNGCPICGSTERVKNGFYPTTAYRYQKYICKNDECQHHYRSAFAEPGSRSSYRRI